MSLNVNTQLSIHVFDDQLESPLSDTPMSYDIEKYTNNNQTNNQQQATMMNKVLTQDIIKQNTNTNNHSIVQINTPPMSPSSKALQTLLESVYSQPDPFNLKAHLKSHNSISIIKSKKTQLFYTNQNKQILELLRAPDFVEENEELRLIKLKIAIYGSVVANVVLFALQVVAAYFSSINLYLLSSSCLILYCFLCPIFFM